MSSDNYTYLIYKQIKGTLTSDEVQRLNAWLKESDENLKIKQDINSYVESSDKFQPSFEINLDTEYQRLQEKMQLDNSNEKPKNNSFIKYAILAISLVALVMAFLYISSTSKVIENQNFKTLPGEIKEIQFSDGSVAWLNENSSINYPESFERHSRNVILKGEAYFEVAKNPDAPFIIELDNSRVEVLGTSFNINSTSIDSTVVTVATGLVRFSNKSNATKVDLQPFQRGVLKQNGDIVSKYEINTLNELSWQSKKLSFKNTTLSNVFTDLEKHFNIVIECENSSLLDCKFSMTERIANLDSILSSLEKLKKVTIIKKNNSTYLISGGRC